MTTPQVVRLVRYGFAERMMHGVTAVSYVYLLLSGLAFWTPALYWMAIVLGGGYLTRVLHPWVGLVFAAAVVWMFVVWRADMRTTDADRQWRRAMRHYIRNEDDRVPGAGRFNYGQKSLFWAMVIATALLLLSGLVLWWPEAFLDAPGIRQAAVLVHAVAALVTIGAFIVHLYMGLAVVPGGLAAIVRGDVSESWARHHHPRWADELASRSETSPRGWPRTGRPAAPQAPGVVTSAVGAEHGGAVRGQDPPREFRGGKTADHELE